ncbi:MAG: helix-turn-helix domain-containing protein [Aliidongia sp.]|jgi:transcriptional regulator with XRE-family HTH domain
MMARLSRPMLDRLTDTVLDRLTQRAAAPRELAKRARTKHAWAPFAQALNRHVAHRLLLLRRCHGKTQIDMAALCGLSFQQFGKYERGLSHLPADKMWLIATCFGIDTTYFFEGFDPAAVDRHFPIQHTVPDDSTTTRLRIAAALARIIAPRKLRTLVGLVDALADK